jgi:uncharacterized protein (TIGR02246 family)
MTAEKDKSSDEAQIRQLMDDWAQAFRSMDIEGVMASYAPDVVAFDILPPMKHAGADAYRKLWEQCFAAAQGAVDVEIRDLSITTGDDVAFSHMFSRCSGSDDKGQKFEIWTRSTACFRKINGKWLIVHEHFSVPVDMEIGKAMMALEP